MLRLSYLSDVPFQTQMLKNITSNIAPKVPNSYQTKVLLTYLNVSAELIHMRAALLNGTIG